MSVDVFWIPCDTLGRIGIATRPRGGDWLKEDIDSLHKAGTSLVVSMLTPDESLELQLEMEEKLCQDEGIDYQLVPIPDRGVPSNMRELAQLAHQWAKLLENGKNIIFHCRQGIGRSAMMVALVLVTRGTDVDSAFQIIEKARKRPVPDTEEQRTWVEQYAVGLQIAGSLKVAEKVEPYKPVLHKSTEQVESEIIDESKEAQQAIPADSEKTTRAE
jgi:protein-tyrosine phosphatase